MKVRELIAQLQTFNPEAEVLHGGKHDYDMFAMLQEDNAKELAKNRYYYSRALSVYLFAAEENAVVRFDYLLKDEDKAAQLKLAEEIARQRRVEAEQKLLDEAAEAAWDFHYEAELEYALEDPAEDNDNVAKDRPRKQNRY